MNKTRLPVFTIQARPLCIPPELRQLPSTTGIEVVDKVGARDISYTYTVGDLVDDIRETIERQAQGYFTIIEAAQILADAVPGVDARTMAKRMLHAFEAGQPTEFKIRNPGDKMPVLDKAEVRSLTHMVKPSDVDALLHSLGVHYRFPVDRQDIIRPEPVLVTAETKELKQQALASGPTLSTNKAALISQHEHEWPTIRRDIQDASTNGLSKAAKAGVRDWNEEAAIQWARSKNKLIQATQAQTLTAVMGSLPSMRHRIQC